MISWTALQSAIIMGKLNCEYESKYKASFWYLPGGTDVVNAVVHLVSFEDLETRDMFVRLHKDDDSMACAE